MLGSARKLFSAEIVRRVTNTTNISATLDSPVTVTLPGHIRESFEIFYSNHCIKSRIHSLHLSNLSNKDFIEWEAFLETNVSTNIKYIIYSNLFLKKWIKKNKFLCVWATCDSVGPTDHFYSWVTSLFDK